MASALNIAVKLKHFTHCHTGNGVQHVNNDHHQPEGCRHEFFEAFRSSHEWRRQDWRGISNMTTIISWEELARWTIKIASA